MVKRKIFAVWCAVMIAGLLTGTGVGAKKEKKVKKIVKNQESRQAMIKRFCDNTDKNYEILGYVEQKDDILDRTFSFLIFQETHKDSGESVVRITSNWLTGATLNEKRIGKLKAKAAKEGAEYVTTGSPFVPPKGDKRIVEYRYYPDEKKVEVFAAFRDFKRKRKKPVSASGYPSSWGGSVGEAAEEEVEEKASETTEKIKEKATKSKSKKLKKLKKWLK